MNPSARHRLIEDTLLSGVLVDSLTATRRAARHRRVRRRVARVAMAACAVLAAGWFLRQPIEMRPDAPVVATAPAPAFILITTAPADAPRLVRTAAAPSALIVSTRDATGPTPGASEDDLFALAGSRPAALHRLPDGSARWMWLDDERRF